MTEWISDAEQFNELFWKKCYTCVFIDSGREPTSLVQLSFDDAGIVTRAFAGLLQQLLEWSGDTSCFYVVLRPDPVHFFHRLFGRYPAIEIQSGISAEEYLAALNKGPEQSPSDALGTIYDERIIVPPSLGWFVHSFQSSEDTHGHLWIPAEWVDRVVAAYPFTGVPEPLQKPA
jgi:hypothetical protein